MPRVGSDGQGDVDLVICRVSQLVLIRGVRRWKELEEIYGDFFLLRFAQWVAYALQTEDDETLFDYTLLLFYLASEEPITFRVPVLILSIRRRELLN